MKLINVEVENINRTDYPDFVDAYISYAEKEDGTPLTEEELEAICPVVVLECVYKKLY